MFTYSGDSQMVVGEGNLSPAIGDTHCFDCETDGCLMFVDCRGFTQGMIVLSRLRIHGTILRLLRVK